MGAAVGRRPPASARVRAGRAASNGRRSSRATRAAARSSSGLTNLVVLKTTDSAFAGFPRDEFTTLPDTDDRILATSITASWTLPAGHDRLRGARARSARRWSRRSPRTTADRCSTRCTRWARRRWPRAPTSTEITLTLPNRHHLLVDLTPFGLDNPNEVFVATDQPFGLIEATIRRSAEATRLTDQRAMRPSRGDTMAADLSTTFTGVRFQNPFLLSSAPPTESESNILRAFEAGWGGVVTKTIGLHPVVNVARAEDQVPARRRRLGAPVDEEAAGRGAALVVELGAHLRQDARLVGAAARPDQEGVSRARARRLDHGRLGQRHRAAALAELARRLPGRRAATRSS